MNLEEFAVMTPKKFAIKIETIVKVGGVTYMDAILDYCEKKKSDGECNAISLISKPLKGKNRGRCKGTELSSKGCDFTNIRSL